MWDEGVGRGAWSPGLSTGHEDRKTEREEVGSLVLTELAGC